MRDVVKTTLLSKRWNYPWTTLPCLCFNRCVTSDNVEKIRNFINRALLLWKGTKILKFHLVLWGQVDESLYRDVNLWLRFVTEKKVEDLHLQLPRTRSLKELIIYKNPYSKTEYDLSTYAVLTIWAPNLETLILSGRPYSKCLLMDASSLTDVTLDLEDLWDVVLGETLRQILPTFQHVEKLTLLSWCFKALAVMKGEYSFSPLSNVKLLRLIYDHLIKPNEIVGLLEIFPKLKMLEFTQRQMVNIFGLKPPGNILSKQDIEEPLNSEVKTIKSLMMQLRIVEICWYKYEKLIFQIVEFFLEHATMLEKIVIQKSGSKKVESDDMILAAEKLLSLQRSFPNVELIFCKERC